MKTAPPAANFRELTPPSTDFGAVIDGRRSPPLVFELDLSTARDFAANTAIQLRITGNSFYIDQAPDVGNAYVIFEGVQDDTGPLVRPAIYVQPGYVARVPYANLRIANTAQPGKKLRIIYGTDIDFLPSLNGTLEIGGSVNAVPYGMPFTGHYDSTTALAAGASENVFTAAANVNGAIIYGASFISSNASGANCYSTGYIAKAGAAPASITDGNIIVSATSLLTGLTMIGKLPNPIRLQPGMGLWFFTTLAETANFSLRHVEYELL